VEYQSHYATLKGVGYIEVPGTPGETVTVNVVDQATGLAVSLASSTTVERTHSSTVSFYIWSTSQLTTQPTSEVQYRIVFTDSAGAVDAEKIKMGGAPDAIARTTFSDGAVHIDTINGSAGTDYPLGTPGNPVSNITNAKTIADAWGFKKYYIRGAVTLNATHQNWQFFGASSALNDELDYGSQDCLGSTSDGLTITGACGGTPSGSNTKKMTLVNCQIDALTGFGGAIVDCSILNTLTLASGAAGALQMKETKFPNLFSTLNCNGASTVRMAGVSGLFSITNFTFGGGYLAIDGVSAEITLAASCTTGSYAIAGTITLIDSSATMSPIKDETFNRLVHMGLVNLAMTSQGYTTARAPNLDNLDATVSSRESESSASTRATTDQTEHDATQTAIASIPSAPTAASIASEVLKKIIGFFFV
jgi:hypothetical protein